MKIQNAVQNIIDRRIVLGNHPESDYFGAIKDLVSHRNQSGNAAERQQWQDGIDRAYDLVRDEILKSTKKPASPVKFGTSGWRGLLGKDITIRSVAAVTAAILSLYRTAEDNPDLQHALGVQNFKEMQQRGCVVGFDNRFAGKLLALSVMNILAANGIRIFYAGEATTGILSASVLEHNAAFSINLTPSHNPLEYGGFKYNAADAGPAAPILTSMITEQARTVIETGTTTFIPDDFDLQRPITDLADIIEEDALKSWQRLIRKNRDRHGLDYDQILTDFARRDDIVVGVDAVHGASRTYIKRLLNNPPTERLFILREEADVTFGGIAPEPSSTNMRPVIAALHDRPQPFKVGAVIDPDGDRIRFTDGSREIDMNRFGAMAYHFLHEIKGKKGMVAKTVASSNLANAVAKAVHEQVFEPRVGFKEFKPVIGRALVCFEESDGISIIGHTPEKDAFIGLLLAIDMVLTLKKNLGDYLDEIENTYGACYPGRDGVEVSRQGEELLSILARLEKYGQGVEVVIGNTTKRIREVITIDGRKMIFDDDSWIMIRPSGTEPKVRLYVEARKKEETTLLIQTAQSMLAEIGLLA